MMMMYNLNCKDRGEFAANGPAEGGGRPSTDEHRADAHTRQTHARRQTPGWVGGTAKTVRALSGPTGGSLRSLSARSGFFPNWEGKINMHTSRPR